VEGKKKKKEEKGKEIEGSAVITSPIEVLLRV
jgi:hypothetical protein